MLFLMMSYAPSCAVASVAAGPRSCDVPLSYHIHRGGDRIQIKSDIEEHRELSGVAKWGKEIASIFERIATEKRIRDGEMFIIDMGCVYKGYTGDLGRRICVSGRREPAACHQASPEGEDREGTRPLDGLS